MKEWIFKIIYWPIIATVMLACIGILTLMLKDTGWEQPLRWLCIIAVFAYIADFYVNK